MKNPRCSQDDGCQLSFQVFSLTIDSLLSSSRSTISMIYLIISACISLFGLISNISSFVTFQRSTHRKTVIGQFLLIITLLNILSFFHFILELCSQFSWILSFVDSKTIKYHSLSKSFLFTLDQYSIVLLVDSWITIDRLISNSKSI